MTTTNTRKPPRYQGRITSWKDDQGFGFIGPNGGGPAVFLHISAFERRGIRPAAGDIVTYELGVNEKGQPRAGKAAFVLDRAASRPRSPTTQFALVAAGVFFVFLGASVLAGKLPLPVFLFYLVASAVAFIAYALDKAAARENRRRTPENTLHLLAFIGGWPGALLAQRRLRHKSSKASFLGVFWFTVVANCAVLAWLLSAAGSDLLRAMLG